jgi:hypothetical protein
MFSLGGDINSDEELDFSGANSSLSGKSNLNIGKGFFKLFLTVLLSRITVFYAAPAQSKILYAAPFSDLTNRVAELHHVDAAPAPTLLYSTAKFLKGTKVQHLLKPSFFI